MISAFANTFKIPELRQRIIFTLLVIVIIRLGAVITLPGVDASVLADWMDQIRDQTGEGKGGAAAMLAMMSNFFA